MSGKGYILGAHARNGHESFTKPHKCGRPRKTKNYRGSYVTQPPSVAKYNCPFIRPQRLISWEHFSFLFFDRRREADFRARPIRFSLFSSPRSDLLVAPLSFARGNKQTRLAHCLQIAATPNFGCHTQVILSPSSLFMPHSESATRITLILSLPAHSLVK